MAPQVLPPPLDFVAVFPIVDPAVLTEIDDVEDPSEASTILNSENPDLQVENAEIAVENLEIPIDQFLPSGADVDSLIEDSATEEDFKVVENPVPIQVLL